MAKPNKKIKGRIKEGPRRSLYQRFRSLRSQIHPETEQSILAIILIGLAAVLILAKFSNAGPAGEFLFKSLTTLFGLGYYLFPTIFLIMAGVFLSHREQKKKRSNYDFFGRHSFYYFRIGPN